MANPLFISEIIDYWAREKPDCEALRQDSLSWSYLELSRKVTETAASLKHLGFKSGESVLICLPNSISFAVFFFACIKLRLIPVTISPQITSNELTTILENNNLAYVISIKKNLNQHLIESHSIRLEVENYLYRVQMNNMDPRIDNDLAIFASRFSSGSTGNPKRINYTESNLNEDVWHLSRDFNLLSDERYLGVTPFYHAFGGLNFLTSLSNGGTLFVVDKFWPTKIFSLIKKEKITTFLCTPSMIELLLETFLEDEDTYLSTLKTCICATGKISPEKIEKFFQRFQIKTNILFGSTETLSASFCMYERIKTNSIGVPFSGINMQVFDEHHEVISSQEIGKIGIKGMTCVDPRYNQSISLNKHGFIIPGDDGFKNSNGDFFVLGRENQINIGGLKVDPYEIEQFIYDTFPITYAKVFSYNRQNQNSLGLLVESQEPSHIIEGKILDKCKSVFSDYKIPSKILVKTSIQRDANGKISKTTINAEISNET